LLFSLNALAAKAMNGACSRQALTRVDCSFWDEIFLSHAQRDSLLANDQGVLSLQHGQVFIEFVRVFLRYTIRQASPESGLAPIRAIEDIAFNFFGVLGGAWNFVEGMLHELREIIHASSLFSEELLMPAWQAQQEDENKVGRAILRASLGQPSLPSQRAQSARSTFA
jgi:hypothetical protein